jgi:hypothetical protein
VVVDVVVVDVVVVDVVVVDVVVVDVVSSPGRPQPANSNAAIDTARTPAKVFAMPTS